MNEGLHQFETIVRRARHVTEARHEPSGGLHPFQERNIHSRIELLCQKLFDDGHYSQATFEAFKLIDKTVQSMSKLTESGTKLMMKAFQQTGPQIRLTDLSNQSEIDEQEGYKFLFSGSVLAIRNPRGHEFGVKDAPDLCLDHLSLASLMLRRLESAR